MANIKNVKSQKEIDTKEPAAEINGRRKPIIFISSLALTLVLIFSLVSCSIGFGFNYEKKNISKYIHVPEELYTSYDVKIDIPEITDFDVNEEIIKLLYDKRIVPEGPIYSYNNVTISAGDVVYFYCRGYIEENGVKKYLDGQCNFSGSYESIAVGFGKLGEGKSVPGFESGLIGKNPQDYATFNKKTSGVVEDGDIVAFTYSVFSAHQTSELDKSVVIDLADPTIDARWGEGFRDFIVGQAITPGKELIDEKGDLIYFESGTDTVYSYITINSACNVDDSENEMLIVPVYYPFDYDEEELRGKTGYFEMYIIGVDDYGCYDFNDEFITDVLEVKAENMESYAGDTLTEKYKSFIRQTLEEYRQISINALAEEAFWEQVLAGVKVKKLPKREVDRMYDDKMEQLVSSYQYQSAENTFSGSLDTYAREYLKLGSNANWKNALRKLAEEAVIEKLIFYYIIQEEGLTPSKEDYDRIYDVIFSDHLQEYLDYYGITEDSATYEKDLAKGKEDVLDAYGEEYFNELVIYDYVMTEIVSRANIIVTTP